MSSIAQDLHTRLTDPKLLAMMQIGATVRAASRSVLATSGCLEIPMPLIGPVTDPGSRGGKQVSVDFYGAEYKLMTSAILYKQASLLIAPRIYSIAPNVRLEPYDTVHTGRHLIEFNQVDVELRDSGRLEAMQLVEDVVKGAIRAVLELHGEAMRTLGRETDKLKPIAEGDSFDVVTHAEAIRKAAELGAAQSKEAEISWEAERLFSQSLERPTFVTDYPKGSRGFYDREHDSLPGTLTSFDLLVPEGYGEICSGAERENRYPNLVTRIRESGENPRKYQWYLDLAREGLPSSAGFGIGAERLISYIGGRQSVVEATPFPKVAGVHTP